MPLPLWISLPQGRPLPGGVPTLRPLPLRALPDGDDRCGRWCPAILNGGSLCAPALRPGAGLMLLVFALAFFYSARHGQEKPRWLLKLALFSLPLPWIASEAGWFVAEYGRQPWAIAEILPIHTAVSNLAVSDVVISLIAVTVFYTVMFIIGLSLMIKFARKGPGVIAPAASAERLQGVES